MKEISIKTALAIVFATILFVGFAISFAKASTTVCQVFNGCTGTGVIPTTGQVLVGNSGGTYTPTATSSLGIADPNWRIDANGNLTPTTTIPVVVPLTFGVATNTPAATLGVHGNVWIDNQGPVSYTTIGIPLENGINAGTTDTFVVGTTSSVNVRASAFSADYTGSASNGSAQAFNSFMRWIGTANNTSGTLRAGRAFVSNTSSGYNVASISALTGQCANNGTLSSTTDCIGFNAETPTVSTGDLTTNYYGFRAVGGAVSGTLTNRYGLYVDNMVGGTNRWGVYQAGTTDNNYFAGNTGVGSSTPWADLSIAGNTNQGGPLFAVSTSTPTATTTKFIIDRFGNVGIGTSTPNTFNAVANSLVVYNSGNAGIGIKSGGTTNNSTIAFGNDSNDVQGRIIYDFTSNLMRFTTNGSSAANAAMVINSSGQVGIGTTSPNSLLSVRGGVAASAANQGTVQFGASPAASSAGVELGTYTGGYGMLQGMNFVSGGANSLAINPFGGTTVLNATAGSVGIGTTTPGSLLSLGDGGSVNGINFQLGTSTFSGSTHGLNITSGCYAINGTCVGGSGGGGVSSVTGTYPVQSSGGSTPAISLAFSTSTANTWGPAQTFSTALTVQGTGTSTFSNGIDLSGGCFSVSSTCLQTFIQNSTAYKSAANYATAAVLGGTPTYSNGTAGVGATLTEVGTGALSVDGQAPSVGQRVLIKNQADQTTNGVYTVTATGSGIASYILTRSTDFNSPNDIYAGVTVPVLAGGTTNGGTSWVETTTGTITVGTSNIVFAESSTGSTAAPIAANSVLANGTSATAVPTAIATSSLYGTGTGGQVLGWSNATGGLAFVATSSASGSGTTVTRYFATSSVASSGNSVYQIIPVVAGDTVEIWGQAQDKTAESCSGGNATSNFIFKQSSFGASTTPYSLNTFNASGNAAGCSLSSSFSFTATTTDTLTLEQEATTPGARITYYQIIANKYH